MKTPLKSVIFESVIITFSQNIIYNVWNPIYDYVPKSIRLNIIDSISQPVLNSVWNSVHSSIENVSKQK
jgi:hypothetical protein